MEKYTQSEGNLEVLRGRQANVLHDYFQRTGKADVGQFSDAERLAFDQDLDAARKADDLEQAAVKELSETAIEKEAPKPRKKKTPEST